MNCVHQIWNTCLFLTTIFGRIIHNLFGFYLKFRFSTHWVNLPIKRHTGSVLRMALHCAIRWAGLVVDWKGENPQKNPNKSKAPRLIELFPYPPPLSSERGFFNIFVWIVMVFSDSLDSNITNTIYFLLKPFSVPLVSRSSATRWSVKKAQSDSFPKDNGQHF